MSVQEAQAHFETAADFDYGYSPIWYIDQEINCEAVKGKGIISSE